MTSAWTAAAIVLLIAWRVRPQPAARLAGRHRRIGRWLVAAAVGGGALLVSPFMATSVAISGVLLRRWQAIRSARRRSSDTSAAYPDALDLLVLSIRAGYTPAQAVVVVIPFLPYRIQPAFAAVADEMNSARRFADALTQLSQHLGPIAQPLVDSLSAADRYGLPLAPVLERLSFEARQQRRRDADAAARELPVRLAMPLVLCTLPSFVLLAIVPLLLGALSSLHA
jgi:tight adherence protein C